jgi:esterase
MKLFFREYGNGQPIVILHGLFGSSDNWLTQAKLLSSSYKIFTVDLRNHGSSPHHEEFNYKAMVEDINEFMEDQKLTDVTLMGHSMGGKAAMNFSLAYPQKIERLIVVDIAPRFYDLEHYIIADGLAAIPIETISSRNEAEDVLSEYVSDSGTRQFLLKNLQRKAEGGFSWKINLPVIREQLSNIGEDLLFEGTFAKPTLFIRGRNSSYVLDGDMKRIKEVFPLAKLETMDTGHWVQAEKPQEFVGVVQAWLQQLSEEDTNPS